MVSDSICPCHRSLRFNGTPVSKIIEPGKKYNGIWQAPDIMKQLEDKAILAIEQMHPDACGLFVVNYSTNHVDFVVNALVCSKMNLNSRNKFP
jgi:hypothetical protein